MIMGMVKSEHTSFGEGGGGEGRGLLIKYFLDFTVFQVEVLLILDNFQLKLKVSILGST